MMHTRWSARAFFRIANLLTLLFVAWNSSSLLWGQTADIPANYQLIYQQTFDDAKSLEDYQFSDGKAWRWSSEGKSTGAIELFQQSQYKTEHRSPFNLAILSKHQVSDFILELDMRQTGKEYGHRDMCLYFAFQGRSQFYYTHLATTPDPNAHNVFIVDNAPRKSFLEVPKKGVNWGEDWKHIRLERQGDRIRVYFEDMKQPVLEGRHSALASGAIGFGSFDDVGKMDNLKLWAPKEETQSITYFP
ncbi:MAG: hypothetical protein U0905_19255 [Pirellulales bacterium]